MHNYLQMINDIDLTMDILQSERIGITIEKFKQLISNDWWLTSNTAKKYNVIDDSKFPEISRFDPVSTLIGLRPDNLCKIIRPSKTSITSEFYRLCYNK